MLGIVTDKKWWLLMTTLWQRHHHVLSRTSKNKVWFNYIYYLGFQKCRRKKKKKTFKLENKVQFSSVAQSCPTLCDPIKRRALGLPVHHQLPVFPQTHVHRVSDAIQPSHPLSSPSPPAPNPSQHQSLFQWVNSSHEVAKVLEFQL